MDTNTNDIDNISLPEARVDSDNTGLLSDVIEILELDMFMNQNQSNCDGLVGGIVASATGGAPIGTSIMDTNGQQAQQTILQQHQQQQQQQQPPQQQTQSTLQQQHQQQSSSKGVRKKPYVKIVEQPASKGLRFRYECEGRSAGSIPGVNSTPDNKTFPTIEIVGYKGRAVVVVSCVTKDAPYRPHPHNLVGKEGCKKGVCTIEINSETMRAVFSNLGIQCVKKKDIAAALKAREEIRVDPFKTGSTYKNQTSNIDLNSVRLCFQVFLEGEQKGRFTQPIAPVVSDPIYDKKAMSDLVICRLCSCSSTVAGGATIILLCEKVSKDDISVRFYQEKNGKETWVAFGEFQQTDVHKQTAITFKTPRFHTMEIDKPETVFIQLYRPSDGITSESLPFDYVPLESDSAVLKRKRQKTGGDAMHLIRNFQELQQQQQKPKQLQQQQSQQQQQQQRHDHHDGPALLSTMNWNIPAIKTEPRDASPQSFGLYRAMSDHATPSPQPASPSNPYNSANGTPSPYSMSMAGGNVGNNLMMSPKQTYGTQGVGLNIPASNADSNMQQMQNFGGYQQQTTPSPQFQTGLTSLTPFVQTWNSNSPAVNQFQPNQINHNPFAPNNLSGIIGNTTTAPAAQQINNNQLNSNHQDWNMSSMTSPDACRSTINQSNIDAQQILNQLLLSTHHDDVASSALGQTTNIHQNNSQPHPHPPQSNDIMSCTESGPSVSNLFNLDSDQLMSINMNSEDLQISNLSIST